MAKTGKLKKSNVVVSGQARNIISRLGKEVTSYLQSSIIPHCTQCTRPCCALTDVVLCLTWRQLKEIYSIEESRKKFDEALASGHGHRHIRMQGGRYYAFGSPCPAYNAENGLCKVYKTTLKPESCTDFPVYLDGNTVTADKRCEAVNESALMDALRRAVPGVNLIVRADAEFPFLLSIVPAPHE